MDETLTKLLEGATQDELIDCIGLIAISVAQHRRKNGFVPLGDSAKYVHPGALEDADKEVTDQGWRVAEEALEVIRVLTAERLAQSASQGTSETSGLPMEKRRQLRIHVSAAIKVLWPEDSEPVAAKLENISWGGAAIHVEQLKTDNGDTLQIMVPVSQGSAISIEAKILRTWDLPDGKGYGLATRFSSLSTRDELELEKLLKLLAESADADGQRNHARLTQRLDIEFDGVQELQATLDDISAGGMGITVPEPLQIGQSLQTVISALDGSTSLKLRARVVRQDAIQLGTVEVYRAGLKFEHNAEDLQERIDELLRKMAAGKSANFG
ncbi:Flagellar brake protein YcgR [Halioglobus japonicus]|nr:Flagellar brake protein YcgR [Halioglobus japonicus]